MFEFYEKYCEEVLNSLHTRTLACENKMVPAQNALCGTFLCVFGWGRDSRGHYPTQYCSFNNPCYHPAILIRGQAVATSDWCVSIQRVKELRSSNITVPYSTYS